MTKKVTNHPLFIYIYLFTNTDDLSPTILYYQGLTAHRLTRTLHSKKVYFL